MPLPTKFAQADINRAMRAAQKAPGSWRVRLEPDGAILIEPAEGALF